MRSGISMPTNIDEFNQIAGLIFAQLYGAFPIAVPVIDRDGIAEAMGANRNAWSQHKLPSGRNLSDVMGHTIAWLVHQKYIVSSGSHPAERVVLSDKGLAALNAVPEKLSGSVGSALVKETEGRNWSAVGELVGSTIAGYQKTIMGG
jgi:hypothetical protein